MTRAPLPRLGLGCATLGRGDVSDHEAAAALVAALAGGIRYFDAAPLYGGGLAERRLGRALAEMPRADLFVSTKVGYVIDFAEGARVAPAARRQDFSAAAVRASVFASLDRLRLDRLDLVYLHDAADADSVVEAVAALGELVEAGIVGGIGLGTNDVAPGLALMARLPLDVVMIAGRHTLLDRSAAPLLAEAAARSVQVVAAGVFNSGLLAAADPARSHFAYAPPPPEILARVTAMADIAARHGVSLTAAALAFPLRDRRVTTLMLGARSSEQVTESLALLAKPLPEPLFTALDALVERL